MDLPPAFRAELEDYCQEGGTSSGLRPRLRSELMKYCQELLKKYRTQLRRSHSKKRVYLTTEEFEIIHRVLQLHEKAAKKIGVGVDKIFVAYYVRDEITDGSFCFHVQRVDGSEEAFSYKNALGQRKWIGRRNWILLSR